MYKRFQGDSIRYNLLVGAALSALSVSPLHAQTSDAGADRDGGIKEIIVTAQKREESASKVGMSITSVGGDDLVVRNITSAEDLSRVVPGFTYANSAFNVPVYSVRGVGFNDNALGASPTVTVYIDQVSLPYSAMTQGATLDIERLEVLKGPQGTLFGQNSTAGAINFIARKPTDEFEGGASITFGRFNNAKFEGFVSGPIGGTAKARLAASREIGGDWQRSLTRSDTLGQSNRGAARFLLDWEPVESLKIAINVNGWMDKSDSQAGQLVDVRFGNANPANQLAIVRDAPRAPRDLRTAEWTDKPGSFYEGDNWFYQTSLRADLDLGDFATLTSVTAYNRFSTIGYSDIDGIDSENGEVGFDGDIKAFNQELRLSGDTGPLRWILGGYYAKDKIRDFQPDLAFGSSSGAQNLVGVHVMRQGSRSRSDIETKAVFASAELQFSPLFKAVGGIRYTKEDRRFEACGHDTGDGLTALAFSILQGFLSGGLPPSQPFGPGECITLGPAPSFSPGVVVADLNEDNVSWNAGLNVTPSDSSLLYARVSRGYKSGSFPTQAYTSIDQITPVTQESVLAYEVGFKTTVLDRKLRLEGAAFYYDYTDKQLKGKKEIFPFGALNALQNIPKSRVKGAEFSALAQPAQGWSINASVLYLDTEITEFTGFDPNGIVTDLAGSRFNFSPKWQVQGGAQYDWAVSGSLDASVGFDVVHRSQTTGVLGGNDPAFFIPKYTLLDVRASVGAADDAWRLSLWGKNVTNEFYLTNALRDVDTIVRFTGRPATYGATMAVKF